jgi:hypothetical protein
MSVSYKPAEPAQAKVGQWRRAALRAAPHRLTEASAQLDGVTETIRRLADRLTTAGGGSPADIGRDLAQAISNMQTLTGIIVATSKRAATASAPARTRTRARAPKCTAEDAAPQGIEGLAVKLKAAASLVQSLTAQIKNMAACRAAPLRAPDGMDIAATWILKVQTMLASKTWPASGFQLLYHTALYSAHKRMILPETGADDQRRLGLYVWAVEGALEAYAADDIARCTDCVGYAHSFYNLLDAK